MGEVRSLPRIGFGTAPVLGRIGRRESVRAIRLALDLGVAHFDTARSYGWGEAEGLLGEVLAGVPRERLTIVSKCGIVPTPRSRMLGVAKAAARRLVAVAPGLRRHVTRVASSAALQPTRTYDVALLERSVRESLAELRTPYLDLLILHNFEAGRPGLAAVVGLFRRLVDEGTIRRYGFSLGERIVDELDWLAQEDMLDGAVIQAPLGAGLLALPARFRDVEIVVHSPFRAHAGGARQDDVDLARLADRLQEVCDCRAIVCSMFSEAHLRANVAALDR